MTRVALDFPPAIVASPGRSALNTVAQFLLAFGLVSLVLGGGVLQFPIIGLLGIALLLAALIFLIAAGILIRGTAISTLSATTGLVLFLIVAMTLCVTVAQASMLAYVFAKHAMIPDLPEPADSVWPVVVGSLVAPLLLGLGLYLRTGWWLGRVMLWVWASLLVCPAAMLTFRALLLIWTLNE